MSWRFMKFTSGIQHIFPQQMILVKKNCFYCLLEVKKKKKRKKNFFNDIQCHCRVQLLRFFTCPTYSRVTTRSHWKLQTRPINRPPLLYISLLNQVCCLLLFVSSLYLGVWEKIGEWANLKLDKSVSGLCRAKIRLGEFKAVYIKDLLVKKMLKCFI